VWGIFFYAKKKNKEIKSMRQQLHSRCALPSTQTVCYWASEYILGGFADTPQCKHGFFWIHRHCFLLLFLCVALEPTTA
jgi:hypothetical protein